MKFLDGQDTLHTVAEFLKSEEEEIALAVAFWGSDAIERLGIETWQAKRVRLICDATSGACNPRALEGLRAIVKSRAGWSLRTNSRLHAKVYWTPGRVVVTSANASASGLSLQDRELDGNIEAGIDATSTELLVEAKDWFDRIHDSQETVEVGDEIIAIAKKMWRSRRRNRPSLLGNKFSVTDALSRKVRLEDRDIWVVNYECEERSKEGKSQHATWKKSWKSGELTPPVDVSSSGVLFDAVDDYEDLSLAGYHWNAWIIDLTSDDPHFWYITDRKSAVKRPSSISIPLYGARKIPLGADEWMTISRADIKKLRDRWRSVFGEKSYKWAPMHDLAY